MSLCCFGGRNGIPGPCPLPIVGNIGVLGKDHPGEYLQEWAEKNGSPSVIRLDMGNIPCVVLMNIEAFNDHLKWEFCGRMENVDPLKIWFDNRNDMTSAHGIPWHCIRSLMNKAMDSHEKSPARPKIIETETRELVNTLKGTKGKGIHAVELIRPHVLNLVNMLMYNTRDELDSDAQKLSLESFAVFSKHFFAPPAGNYVNLAKILPSGLGELKEVKKPYWGHYTPKFEEQAKRFSERTKDVADGQHPGVPFIEKKVSEPETNAEAVDRIAKATKPESLIDWMLLHRKADPKAFADVEDKRINFSTFANLHAGSLSVFSYQVDMAMVHLSNNPEWQQKIFDEIAEHCKDDFVPLEAKSKLKNTMAFIYEILRHRMQPHLSLTRQVMDDTTICEYPVDRGTMLLCNLHAIHHDKRFWSEPQKFDPTRFLEGGEGLKNMREGKFVPFNAPRGPGTRGCVAKNFALGALVVIISNIVKNFTIESKDGKPLFDNYKNFFTAYGESMVFKPRGADDGTLSG